ncbi:MAG: hypothetical protein HOL98_10545 [Gammaproteobacteria bacterium]|jgi:hypothetical protein|nr:hypothetical protein [Gammaproteobacteria bacterium]MBT5203879.1 hypothetical protein [Gammaproteobacteria bacterium]MBT5602284.1 hypothetical protein [Gammaproteobacteria bacterium]MBT6246644.1 hypothetical protein [Gammaproteobacteria bacterium]
MHDYLLAWLVYLTAGFLMAIVVWKLSSKASSAWRGLIRGTYLVVTFTPWILADYPGFYAPAFVVLMMDLILNESGSSLAGALALLASFTFMLIFLSFWSFRKAKRSR